MTNDFVTHSILGACNDAPPPCPRIKFRPNGAIRLWCVRLERAIYGRSKPRYSLESRVSYALRDAVYYDTQSGDRAAQIRVAAASLRREVDSRILR